jgi:hypothetical protein
MKAKQTWHSLAKLVSGAATLGVLACGGTDPAPGEAGAGGAAGVSGDANADPAVVGAAGAAPGGFSGAPMLDGSSPLQPVPPFEPGMRGEAGSDGFEGGGEDVDGESEAGSGGAAGVSARPGLGGAGGASEMVGATGGSGPQPPEEEPAVCGDGACAATEAATCCEDCGCAAGHACRAGTCEASCVALGGNTCEVGGNNACGQVGPATFDCDHCCLDGCVNSVLQITSGLVDVPQACFYFDGSAQFYTQIAVSYVSYGQETFYIGQGGSLDLTLPRGATLSGTFQCCMIDICLGNRTCPLLGGGTAPCLCNDPQPWSTLADQCEDSFVVCR